MRSIWKGEVSFGLVNVPVKVYSATEDHDLHARQVDKKDGVRIRYKKVRDDNGEEVEFSDIAKAYGPDECEMVILTKEDLASLPVEQSHEIEVTEFVPADQVDPVASDNANFLEPASRSNRAYVLMREALESTDWLAICTFTLRNRTRLCALWVYKGILMLQTLLWPDEIRPEILGGGAGHGGEGLAAGGQDGGVAHRDHGGGFRAGEVRGRLPESAQGVDRGQGGRR